MPREKPAYRDNLEYIETRFPGKGMLTFEEVIKLFGRDRRTVRKWLVEHGIEGNFVSPPTLARAMS